jgi:hypothetical protein
MSLVDLLQPGHFADPGHMRSGLAAEFVSAEAIVAAAQALWDEGYRRLDAFSPHPVEALEVRLYLGRSRLNWAVFPLGMAGAAFALWLQWYCNAWSYPLNVGGRPPFGWITDIPITFETGILATATGAFVALFWTLGLPRLVHPLFELDGFERASIDRFWLAVDEHDELLDRQRTPAELLRLGAVRVEPFGALRAEVAP